MYRIRIDYKQIMPCGDSWYGGIDGDLPYIPNTDLRFYAIFSISLADLPPETGLQVSVPGNRLVFPHYLNSDLNIDDLAFRFDHDGIHLLGDFDPDWKVFTFPNDFDLAKRAIRFERMRPEVCPGNAAFDDELLEYPHHQLGGTPFFMQPEGHCLACPTCAKDGRFVLQFDNDAELDVSFGDRASAYYWWCDSCKNLMVRVED